MTQEASRKEQDLSTPDESTYLLIGVGIHPIDIDIA